MIHESNTHVKQIAQTCTNLKQIMIMTPIVRPQQHNTADKKAFLLLKLRFISVLYEKDMHYYMKKVYL